MNRRAALCILAALMLAAAYSGCSKAPPPGEAEVGSGQFSSAIETFQSRLAETGIDADEQARIKTMMAYAKAMQRDFAAADALFAEAQQAAESPEARARLQLYHGLALSEQARRQEAATLLASAESAFRDLGMGRSLEFGMCLAKQGVLRALSADGAGGERMLAQAVPILRRYREDFPVFYAEAATDLATLLVMRRDFAAARPHYEEAIESLRTVNSERVADLGHALNGLAYTQYEAGDYSDAERNLRDSIEVFTKAGDENASDVAKCYHDLAKVHEFAHQPAEAEAAFRKAIEIYSAALGPRHPYTEQVIQSTAEFLREQGRESDADELVGADPSLDPAQPPDSSESI